MRVAWLFVAAVVLAAPGCVREKDPLKVMKPPQLIDEAERRLSQGDLDGAEKVYRITLHRLDDANVRGEGLRPVLAPLFHLAVKREDLTTAQGLFARMGEPIDIRAANDLAVMLHRQGKLDDARSMAERMVASLDKAAVDDDERARQIAAWIDIDRLRVARFDRPAAAEASDAVVELLTRHADMVGNVFRPLPRGLRGWLLRYQDHLFDTDRDAVAKRIGDIVERIDQNAPPPPNDALCVSLYRDRLQNLGCMLEIQ